MPFNKEGNFIRSIQFQPFKKVINERRGILKKKCRSIRFLDMMFWHSVFCSLNWFFPAIIDSREFFTWNYIAKLFYINFYVAFFAWLCEGYEVVNLVLNGWKLDVVDTLYPLQMTVKFIFYFTQYFVLFECVGISRKLIIHSNWKAYNFSIFQDFPYWFTI